MKNIVILFTERPLGNNAMAEKLRMCLGLTLNENNRLSLVFMGEARHALEKLNEAAVAMGPVNKHLSMLGRLGASMFAEEGGNFQWMPGITVTPIRSPESRALCGEADAFIH